MELEPRSLNIPLERDERWGLVLVAACTVVAAIAWFVNQPFAVVFAASSIVCLPVLYLSYFPSRLSRRLPQRGNLGRSAVIALLLGYTALAKSVLVPFFVRIIERVLD